MTDRTFLAMASSIAAVVAVAAVAACGTPRARSVATPVAVFPSPEALTAITAQPVPSPRLDEGAVPEQGWTIELPAPGEAASASAASTPWQPRDAWDRALTQAMASAGRSPRMSEAMACIARELGRWTLGHDDATPAGLRRFIIGACGAVATEVAVKALGGELPEEASDDEVFQHWGGQVPDLVASLPAGATEAGFAFVRSGGHAVALLAYAEAAAELEPFSIHPSASGELTLTGSLGGPVDYVSGAVNRGRYGVAPCDVDPTIAPPRFRVTCQVAADDDSAWIELVYSPPRRVLATSFARVLARRPTTTQLTYQPASHATGQAVTSTGQFADLAMATLNEVRARAGLTPVLLNVAESATATRIAPYYFDAALANRSTERLDTIALGLLAGWDVDGMIRDGRFISTLVPRTQDPARWLDDTLELPSGRSALLADGIEQVALGPVLLEEPMAAGAVVVGYRFHHGTDHQADIDRLLARTTVARRQLSLPDPTRLTGLDVVVRRELEQVQLGHAAPAAALQRVLDVASARSGVGMRGVVIEATSLDALQLPDTVLRQRNLRLELGVTHHKPPGAAWAQLVILVVFEDTGSVTSS